MVKLCVILALLFSNPLLAGQGTETREFCFVQIADTQLGMSAKDQSMDAELDNFRKVAERINSLRPAFVLISGDMINAPHNSRQILAFWRAAGRISHSIPLYLVPGNHDVGLPIKNNVLAYRRFFGMDHYAFSHGKSEFIVLNSCLIHDEKADKEMRESQLAWFEQSLSSARSKRPEHIFVCTHHPWFLSSPDEADSYFVIPRARRNDYLELMRRYGAKWALAGHYHRNAVAPTQDLAMITTASVGMALGDDPIGYRVFRVNPRQVEHVYRALEE